MPLSRPTLMAFAAALALAACGQPTEPTRPAPAEPPAAGPPVTADGPGFELAPLNEADMAANPLAGELACSFSTDDGALLLAQGFVASKEPAQGLVKVDGIATRLSAPGGFDGMLEGATFTGPGQTVRIEVTGAAGGSGESPPRLANMAYRSAAGITLTMDGRWTCGP